MEGFTAIKGGIKDYFVIGLVAFSIYLIIKNGRDIKRLQKALMMPAPMPVEDAEVVED